MSEWKEGIPIKPGWYAYWEPESTGPSLLHLAKNLNGQMVADNEGRFFVVGRSKGMWRRIARPYRKHREAKP